MTSPARERGLRRPEGRARRPVKPGRRKISQIATAAAAPAADPPAPAAAAVPGAVSPRPVANGRKEKRVLRRCLLAGAGSGALLLGRRAGKRMSRAARSPRQPQPERSAASAATGSAKR